MPTTTSSSSFSPHVFTIPINTKLDDNNYLIWKQQVMAMLKGLKLMRFLEGNDTHSSSQTLAGAQQTNSGQERF